jgi:hypothetical protein
LRVTRYAAQNQPESDVMDEQAFMTATNEQLEHDFIEDYAGFAAQINPRTITTLVREATAAKDPTGVKLLATAGLQLVYTSIEDFAVLLQAIIQRKNDSYLHHAMSETKQQGATSYPKILKKGNNAAVLDELGLSIDVATLQKLGYDITDETFDQAFSDFGASIKALATDAQNVNTLKNRLKHGKAIFGSAYGLQGTYDIGHLQTETVDGHDSLGMITTQASLEQLRQAAIKIYKISIRSIDLLCFVTIHYHPATAQAQIIKLRDAGKNITAMATSAGISAPGLHV